MLVFKSKKGIEKVKSWKEVDYNNGYFIFGFYGDYFFNVGLFVCDSGDKFFL